MEDQEEIDVKFHKLTGIKGKKFNRATEKPDSTKPNPNLPCSSQLYQKITSSSSQSYTSSSSSTKPPNWCTHCNSPFTPNHYTSIPHQISKTTAVHQETYYKIPPHNLGFRLLEQEGWRKGTGLGIAEEGRSAPVKALVKHDRRGVGSKKKKVNEQEEEVKRKLSRDIHEEDKRERLKRLRILHYLKE